MLQCNICAHISYTNNFYFQTCLYVLLVSWNYIDFGADYNFINFLFGFTYVT